MNCVILKSLRTALAAVAGHFVLSTATGQTVGWHDSIDVHHTQAHNRGKGMDLRNPADPKPFVVALDLMNPTDQGPSDGSQRFSSAYVNSALQIASSLGANLAVSVHGAVAGGSLDVEYADAQSFTENAVTFLFEGTRDFGSRTYPFRDQLESLAPEFKVTVQNMAQTLRGAALHREVVRRYGTHFVYGYRAVARIRVAFQLRFGSTFQARTFRADVSANKLGNSFEAQVSSAFARSGSQVSVSYHFYSSEESLPPDFAPKGELKTFQEFLELTEKATAYLGRMSAAKSKVDSWIVAPLKNAPGYIQLLGGFSPEDHFETKYDDFIRIYSEIRGAKERMDLIVDNDAKMSWLNSAGKSFFRATHRDLVAQLDGLNQRALGHFQTGAELKIKDSELAVLQSYNRLPFPTIRMLRGGDSSTPCCNYRIGEIDAGPNDLAVANAFGVITHQYSDGTISIPSGDLQVVYYPDSLSKFVALLEASKDALVIHPNEFNGVVEFVRARLSESKVAGRVRGLFFCYSAKENISQLSAVIRDGEGAIIETTPWLPLNDQAGRSVAPGSADTALAVMKLTGALAGQPASWTLQVTNAGLETVIGTRVRLPLAAGFEFVSVTGSQGIGGFTNGVVEFQLGALGAGRAATVTLSLRKLTAKPLASPGIAVASVDNSQPEITPNDNQVELADVRTVAPKLNILRPASGTVELSWEAPPGILKAQRTSNLMGDALWVDVPASFAGDSVQSVRLTVEGTEAFFRLSPATE